MTMSQDGEECRFATVSEDVDQTLVVYASILQFIHFQSRLRHSSSPIFQTNHHNVKLLGVEDVEQFLQNLSHGEETKRCNDSREMTLELYE